MPQMIEDTLQIANKVSPKATVVVNDYSTYFEIAKIVIWPIVVLIIVLMLKKTIINLLERINKIGFAGVAAEAVQQKENAERIVPEQGPKNQTKNEVLEKGLGIFSDYTLERASNVVDDESKVKTFETTEAKVEILHKYSQALYLILNFERFYNLIYGSQLYILERVNTHAETRDSLKRFYDSAVKSYPEFYSNYSYDQYLEFLITRELIIFDEKENSSITWLGRDFLKFLVETGRSLNKAY